MKVHLLRDARINHKAGETVEVSPAEFNFLVSVGSAEPVPVFNETVEEVKPKKRTSTKKG